MVFLWQTIILPGRVGFAFRFAAVTWVHIGKTCQESLAPWEIKVFQLLGGSWDSTIVLVIFFYDCSTMIVLLDHCDCYLLFFLYKVDFQPCQLVSAAPWTALVEASLAASPHSSWNHREHVERQHLNMQKTTRHLECRNHGKNTKKSWLGNFLHSERCFEI